MNTETIKPLEVPKSEFARLQGATNDVLEAIKPLLRAAVDRVPDEELRAAVNAIDALLDARDQFQAAFLVVLENKHGLID